jgi:hypothetical protein
VSVCQWAFCLATTKRDISKHAHVTESENVNIKYYIKHSWPWQWYGYFNSANFLTNFICRRLSMFKYDKYIINSLIITNYINKTYQKGITFDPVSVCQWAFCLATTKRDISKHAHVTESDWISWRWIQNEI